MENIRTDEGVETPRAGRSAPSEGPSLGQLARQYLADEGGDTTAAVDALVADLLADTVLLRGVVRAAIADSVSYRVEAAMRTERRQIVSMTADTKAGVIALANGLRRALLDMPLANGVRLRDATKEQVLTQANDYGVKAKDMGHKARWLHRIADAVPVGKKTVGQVMDDERAAALWQETVNDATNTSTKPTKWESRRKQRRARADL